MQPNWVVVPYALGYCQADMSATPNRDPFTIEEMKTNDV